MKKFKLKLITFIFTAIAIIGCSEDGNFSEDSIQNTDLHMRGDSMSDDELIEEIGVLHNNGLDYIYDRIISEEVIVNELTYSEISDLINTYSIDYINEVYYEGSEEVIDIVKAELNDFNPAEENFNEGLRETLISSFENSSSEAILTQIDIIINQIPNSEENNIDEVISELSLLEEEMINGLDKNVDYYASKSTVKTAISSLNYWNTNIERWDNLDNEEQGRGWSWFKDTIADMGTADAYGAAVGAVVGFVSTIATGPGVIAGTAAGAVGYGMNASALAGVRALLD